MSKHFFGYVRVSTVRQGIEGVSLQAQRDSILAYAAKQGFAITQWFEEQQTAAKRGRPILGRMLKELRAGRAVGVIMHKIDRGARNLRDWADLAELMDSGIVVHFANDGLDLSSRGGRLSADIQAVVAADFIRNLREETKKGLRGRLNQGFYPWGAPLGYVDNGGGRLKTICPTTGPLIRQAFQLYGTGEYTLESLAAEMRLRGLVSKTGSPVSQTSLSTILNNSFYTGAIKSMGQTFNGRHEPLISRSIFQLVRAKLEDRAMAKIQRHDFLYRRMLTCQKCDKALIGEKHGEKIYYRCQSKGCRGTSVREGDIDLAIKRSLSLFALNKEDLTGLHEELKHLRKAWGNEREERRVALTARVAQLDQRMARLTDAFLDGHLEGDIHRQKQDELRAEQNRLKDEIGSVPVSADVIGSDAARLLLLVTGAYYAFLRGTNFEKGRLVRNVFSKRSVDVKNVVLEPRFPYNLVFEYPKTDCCSLVKGGPRKLKKVVKAFWEECATRRALGFLPLDHIEAA